ncbi:hypothetical protein [Spirosoma radiotolerans]|uniref:YD repeat-containing protein n=1 Tax=Spirosoma radiotolerans TaxID=1379870 RepID=A0A0E4A033_9BACT|nr:hypothetical protein [Spirosoma radiotolerans]AKD58494.1 hypothetical protein SD10_12595 [Spirosoma radiotolerans]
MKITGLRSGVVYLLLVLVFAGCGDHRIPSITPGTSRLRVIKITQDMPNNMAKVSAFQYDAQGRLGAIIAYQTPDSTVAPVDNNVYTYDAQNRLIQLNRTIRGNASGFETYTFSYNASGQVGFGFRNSNPIYVWSITPVYDADNRVVGSSKSFSVSGVSARENDTFRYTGNNLTSATIIGNANQKGFQFPEQTVNVTYTYDTGINPFYGVFVIPAPAQYASPPSGGFIGSYTYYGGLSNLLNLSQNNVLSDGANTYTYTYNAANLPTSRTTTSNGNVTETLHYEYETY